MDLPRIGREHPLSEDDADMATAFILRAGKEHNCVYCPLTQASNVLTQVVAVLSETFPQYEPKSFLEAIRQQAEDTLNDIGVFRGP